MDVEVREAGPDGELHPTLVQMGSEPARGTGSVGTHQHRNPTRVLVADPQGGGQRASAASSTMT